MAKTLSTHHLKVRVKDPTTGEAIPVGKQVCQKIKFVEIQLIHFDLFNRHPVAGQRRWTQPYLLHPLLGNLADGEILMAMTNHIIKPTY